MWKIMQRKFNGRASVAHCLQMFSSSRLGDVKGKVEYCFRDSVIKIFSNFRIKHKS